MEVSSICEALNKTGETIGAIAKSNDLAASVPQAGAHRVTGPVMLVALAMLLVVATMFAIGIGAYRIAPLDVFRILAATLGFDAGGYEPQQAAVLRTIRLPRVLLGLITGAGLG